jgi:hypothetical protein
MLEVLHELVDALAALKGISDGKQAELHARLDQETAAPAAPKPAPAAAKADVPA